MAIDDSLNQSMGKVVGYYSLLFRLPTYRKTLLLLVMTCAGGGLISATAISPSLDGLVNGTLLGASLFFANLFSDYAAGRLILKQDPIYDLRRSALLSLFCFALWFFFIFVGIAASMFARLPLTSFCLLGSASVSIFRLIVFSSTSRMSYGRLLIASFLQPLLCMIPFLVFWTVFNYHFTFLFIVFSLVVGIVSSFSFISILNRSGEQILGVPSMSLFKAFLLNWIVGLNGPLEDLLEQLSEKKDVEISIIRLDASKPKAVIVVPSVHPGPFKNIGSSLLPSMLKDALEKELGCVVCVPHGLLGHELDLASQSQNEKIIDQVVASAGFRGTEERATPFIKISNGLATACCQIFGNSPFLSFTFAPKTTEDLPRELSLFIHQEMEKRELNSCTVVNAHNSINGTTPMQKALEALKKVASICLEKAESQKRRPFEVGAATVTPEGFSLEDGMGPGGISVVVVKIGDKRTAYVTIDGNNMVSGLREKILSALNSTGINDGEVFTTDTHSVNAVVMGRRGYHPIGEIMNHEQLIDYIKQLTLSAISDLERVEVSCRSIMVPEVKVIGEKTLEALCLLTERTLHEAKRTVVPILAASGLLLMLFFILV